MRMAHHQHRILVLENRDFDLPLDYSKRLIDHMYFLEDFRDPRMWKGNRCRDLLDFDVCG